MFQLTKWYLDIVSDCGDTLIGYVARLTVAGAPLQFASVLVSRPGQPERERSIMRRMAWPALDGDACAWRDDTLAVDGRWERMAPPLVQTLLDDASGMIQWNCHMPRAQARVRVADLEFTGIGYVECLEATLPRLSFPFRTLRWGRHTSPLHSVVWIEWDDGRDCRLVWLDGALQPMATIGANGIAGLEGHRALRFDATRDVRKRTVLPAIARVLPSLVPHVDASLAGMHEHKVVSRSALVECGTAECGTAECGTVECGTAVDDGWAVHEVVHW